MNILFSLCYLNDPGRLERNLKWIDYNLKIKDQLGFDKIVLVDNASDIEELKKLEGAIRNQSGDIIYRGAKENDVTIYRFDNHIPRTGVWEYPYCWRGLEFAQMLVRDMQINKVLFIDSDFYVLTPKLANYIKNLETGWVSWFCHKYGFPEAAMHILCKDTFNKLLAFPIPSYTHYNNQHMEWLLPFTQVHKEGFIGGRQGEGCEPQNPDHDFYGQWNTGCPDMEFDLGAKKEVKPLF